MQALQNFWEETERNLVGSEIEKLFTLQDRQCSVAKKQIFVDELSNTGYPVGAIVQGIKSLVMRDDLKNVKIGLILEASRKFITTEDHDVVDCASCHDGLVPMVRWNPGKDHHLNRTSFACICANGETVRKWKKSPAAWNGQTDQGVNGVDFKRHDHRGIYQ